MDDFEEVESVALDKMVELFLMGESIFYFEFVKLCDYNIKLKKQLAQLERFSTIPPLVNPFSKYEG